MVDCLLASGRLPSAVSHPRWDLNPQPPWLRQTVRYPLGHWGFSGAYLCPDAEGTTWKATIWEAYVSAADTGGQWRIHSDTGASHISHPCTFSPNITMVSDVTLALCGRQASGCVLMAKVVQTSRHAIRNYDQQEKYCSFEKKKKDCSSWG